MITGIDPTVDYVFKLLFGREQNVALLIHLLNSVLNLSAGNRLVALEILNPFNDKEFDVDKLFIVDIKARAQNGRWFLIEMQALICGPFASRVLYYWARAYQGQLREGMKYEQVLPTISICF